jgi:hypothetical protein
MYVNISPIFLFLNAVFFNLSVMFDRIVVTLYNTLYTFITIKYFVISLSDPN